MATLNIFNTSIGRAYGEYTYTQNIANNTTTINSKVIFICNGGGGGSIGLRGGVQLGPNFYNGGTQGIPLAYSGTYVLMDRYDTIAHNSDGTFPSWFGIQFNTLSEGDYVYSSHVYLDIPTIPRASSITNDTTSGRKNLGTTVNFTISRATDYFLHDLTYVVNGVTYAIGYDIGTNINYTFPESLVNSFPSTAIPNITVNCNTKNNGTVIGSSTTVVYLNIPESYIPDCSLNISEAGNIPQEWGIYVKSRSKLQGTITASGIANSTITSYNTNVNNQTFSTAIFTTSELTSSGQVVVNTQVQDSRGRIAKTSKTIEVVDYNTPTLISYKIDRCLENGTLNDEGTYGKITCNYSISPINNGDGDLNTKSLKVTYRDEERTIELSEFSGVVVFEELFENLGTNASHTFTFELSDYFTTTKVTYVMPIAYTTMSLYGGGKGVTFGQVATEEGLHHYMDTYIHKKIINLFPIGSIYMSVVNTNPSEYFGGTWVAWGAGRVPIGMGSNGTTNYTTVEATGGEDNITLTTAQMPWHDHQQQLPNTYRISASSGSGAYISDGTNPAYPYPGGCYWSGHYTSGVGGGQAHENRQRFITCYMWKRTE